MVWIKKDIFLNSKEEDFIRYLSRLFNTDPFIIQHLYLKGFKNEKQFNDFIFPSILNFHNPHSLNEMSTAVSRIFQAVINNESIVIFGDYDVDGITSTSILYKALLFFKANVHFMIPIREEGYGLNVDSVNKIHSKYQASLIITVDNGSSSHEAILKASHFGIDIIVTDHHEVLKGRPPCFAFINPMFKGSSYPFPHLSGAGVAFKLVHALFLAAQMPWETFMWEYIELASLGTIADMMPLKGENRLISYFGIQKMNTQPSVFFKKLFALLKLSQVTSTKISFKIAPIINSTGRISNPNVAVSLLTEKDPSISSLLELINTDSKRKEITNNQFLLAENNIEYNHLYTNPIIVVQDDFDDGIIGILASKISNKYLKPSIVITKKGKASARSTPNSNFSIIDAIEKCSSLLKSFGGHQGAAGFSLAPSNFLEFSILIQKTYETNSLTFKPMEYDAVAPMENFPSFLFDDLLLLEPFGIGNPKPIFLSSQTRYNDLRFFGSNADFFKLKAGKFNAISFSKGIEFSNINSSFIDFIYNVESKNNFLILDFIQKEKSFLCAI